MLISLSHWRATGCCLFPVAVVLLGSALWQENAWWKCTITQTLSLELHSVVKTNFRLDILFELTSLVIFEYYFWQLFSSSLDGRVVVSDYTDGGMLRVGGLYVWLTSYAFTCRLSILKCPFCNLGYVLVARSPVCLQQWEEVRLNKLSCLHINCLSLRKRREITTKIIWWVQKYHQTIRMINSLFASNYLLIVYSAPHLFQRLW